MRTGYLIAGLGVAAFVGYVLLKKKPAQAAPKQAQPKPPSSSEPTVPVCEEGYILKQNVKTGYSCVKKAPSISDEEMQNILKENATFIDDRKISEDAPVIEKPPVYVMPHEDVKPEYITDTSLYSPIYSPRYDAALAYINREEVFSFNRNNQLTNQSQQMFVQY